MRDVSQVFQSSASPCIIILFEWNCSKFFEILFICFMTQRHRDMFALQMAAVAAFDPCFVSFLGTLRRSFDFPRHAITINCILTSLYKFVRCEKRPYDMHKSLVPDSLISRKNAQC